MTYSIQPVGHLLREWRQRRRLSQLDLAFEADVSSRHLSFVETGRTAPSREMLLHLAEQLEIPLRERNTLLVAGGYAPVYPEKELTDPAMDAARKAVDLVLSGHVPYPALAIDRHWRLVAANSAMTPLLTGVEASLLEPPVNVLRLSLHPKGLAPRIANLGECRSHLLTRLRQQIAVTADSFLGELLAELSGYPAPEEDSVGKGDYAGVVMPMQIVTEFGTLALFSTTTVFGSPVDITLSEIALECFYPADAASAAILRRLTEPS